MPLVRLTYISENVIPAAGRDLLHELQQIGSASRRHNHVTGLTGALAFDAQWFLQILEGERRLVWTALERICLDPRHENVDVLEAVEIPERAFGRWSMAIIGRDATTEAAFAPFVTKGLFRAEKMRAQDVLDLLTSLVSHRPQRQLHQAS